MKAKSPMRRRNGNALIEFGPSLFVLLIIIFFPMINLLTLPMKYAACFTLNSLQLREAAFATDEQATNPNGSVKKTIPDQWLQTGLGAFVHPIKPPVTEVRYSQDDAQLKSRTVTVRTDITLPALLSIPFHSGIPGLGEPLSLTISQTRVLEREV